MGSNVTTLRPAPEYASKSDCNTSLLPFATKTLSADTPCSAAMSWRSAVAVRSGYLFHCTSRTAAETASTKSVGGAIGDSLVLSRTFTDTWGE